MDSDLDQVVRLSRELGDDTRDWVILAEGNISIRVGDDRMYVKVSGRRMADAGEDDFLVVPFAPLIALIDDADADDATVARVFGGLANRVGPPSIESLLHVVCQTVARAPVIAHTHPVAVNALLCSDQADALVQGSVFPDQVVVLGPRQLLVPYADPGLVLARLVRSELDRQIREHGEPPKVIYLRNHGMFALGGSVREVLNITAMASKTATIVGAALACGSVSYLPADEVSRLHSREDEVRRRNVLLRPAS